MFRDHFALLAAIGLLQGISLYAVNRLTASLMLLAASGFRLGVLSGLELLSFQYPSNAMEPYRWVFVPLSLALSWIMACVFMVAYVRYRPQPEPGAATACETLSTAPVA